MLFWKLTLREIGTILKGATARLLQERQSMMWAAWHTAYLTAYAPEKSKKFPKLDKLMPGNERKLRRQSPAEMMSAARAWHGAIQRFNRGN